MGFYAHAHYNENSHIFYGIYSENYVNRWGFQKICHHVFDPRTNKFLWPSKHDGVTLNPADVRPGDIIFVRDVALFHKKLHHKIKHPYIMVTAGEYRDTVKEECIDYLDDEKIIAWFSVHASARTHPKFFMLPLGIYQDKKYYEPRAELTQLFARLRAIPKENLLYSNYGDLLGKKPERAEVDDLFDTLPFCYKAKRLPFLDYMKEMAHFKFTLSPRGYGPDSYRNWEAMLVGSIPIVHTSHLDPLYEDLPILIIHDWKEITEEYLERKWHEMTSKKFTIEKLFMEYWWKKIEEVRQAFLEEYKGNR